MRNILTSNTGNVSKKIKALWADKRPFHKRLILAGAAMAAACFTFIFYGPVEMVAFGGSSLTYSYMDILGIMAVAALLAFAAGTLAISLLKGKIFNYIVTFIFSVTVGGYLQALAFNGDMGSLNGNAIAWDQMKGELFINLFVWAVLFLVVYGILYFSRDLWKRMLIFGSAMLVIMQMAPLVGILTGMYDESGENDIADYAFMDSGMYAFSSNRNILVFVLDRMDFDYIESAVKKDPDILNGLEGFTGYTNAVSRYARTKPALNHMLTGSDSIAYDVPQTDYLRGSWTENGKDLLGDLTDRKSVV